MPNVYGCRVLENKKLTDSVYSITIESEPLAKESMPGQFLHIKCGDKNLLRRPISICSVSEKNIRLVFETKGEGTKWLSKQNEHATLDILGPFGNGFKYPKGNIIVVGGGIGAPPMLYVAEQAKENESVTAILGFRSANDIILKEEFEKTCKKVQITTDDGSAGEHGQVTTPLEKLLKTGTYSAIMSCGPQKMQEAIAKLSKKYNTPCQVSLEERMGCAVGACLVCACEATSSDGTKKMTRVCADGPVYDAKTVFP